MSTKPAASNGGVLAVPQEAFQAIDAASEQAGGAWKPPPGHEGSIGSTMFDMPSSTDGTVTVLLPRENIDAFPSQALVRIESLNDKRTYLGAVVEGPFAEPDGLRADATPMVVTTVQGGMLMPRYHGRAQIEIIGERLSSGTVVPPRRRPKPNSPVFGLDAKETAEILGIQGNLRLGVADGFDDLIVSIPANSKGVFPRHIGVLGTTGGGKSTTVSGIVAKAQTLGVSVILIDTEGEYCSIHEPTDDQRMIEALRRRDLQPTGVKNTQLLHLVGRDTANPNHPKIAQFSLQFCDLSPYALQEILGLSEAQAERFFKAFDVAKLAMERMKIWPTTESQKKEQLEVDEMDTGYPQMTLSLLYDVVAEIAAVTDDPANEPHLDTKMFRDKRKELRQIIGAANVPKNVISWRALQGKLGKIKRLKIFDSADAKPLNFRDMLKPGVVSIIDLSDTDSPQINNLVIARLLHGVQVQQEENYQAAVQKGKPPNPTIVFIEEAHEFLSTDRIKKMEVLFQQVARIARRGRKRWLGLAFITQLPQHLPDEVLGLINGWILHKIGDSNVVNRLRRSIGGISDSLWRQLPSLASGQAIVSFTTLTRPLQVSVDPAPCHLQMVE
jgi:DNA helicase HerA-like ATPase